MPPTDLIVPALSDPGRWGAQAVDWAVHFATRTVFRVRGFGWFDREVGTNVVGLGQGIAQMETLRRTMAGWDMPPFNWKESFAAAQINRAKQGQALRFDKAAKVLLLCESAARAAGRAPGEAFQNMRLEAAVYYVMDFDADMQAYADARPGLNLIQAVANRTGQPRSVLQAMLLGKTVSYRLALLAHRALSELSTELADPRLSPGAVAVRWTHPSAFKDEIIEGPSDPSLEQATQRLAAGQWT